MYSQTNERSFVFCYADERQEVTFSAL